MGRLEGNPDLPRGQNATGYAPNFPHYVAPHEPYVNEDDSTRRAAAKCKQQEYRVMLQEASQQQPVAESRESWLRQTYSQPPGPSALPGNDPRSGYLPAEASSQPHAGGLGQGPHAGVLPYMGVLPYRDGFAQVREAGGHPGASAAYALQPPPQQQQQQQQQYEYQPLADPREQKRFLATLGHY